MLRFRLVSGVLLAVAFVVVALYASAPVVLVAIAASALLGQVEFYSLARRAGAPAYPLVGMLGGMALIVVTAATVGPEPARMAQAYKWEQIVFVTVLLACMVHPFPRSDDAQPVQRIACTFLGMLYVPYLLNFFTRLAFEWDSATLERGIGRTGGCLLLFLVLVVKLSDAGAYFVGRLIGRHKLYPRLSPGKTWEGAAGGVAAAVIGGCVFSAALGGQFGKIEMPLAHAAVLGLALAVTGTVGDLFESLVKRAARAKDSGVLVPGMGGALDVLDSLLFAGPVLYAYVRLFLEGGRPP
jgi:phosphatidate cytidylyltransferase